VKDDPDWQAVRQTLYGTLLQIRVGCLIFAASKADWYKVLVSAFDAIQTQTVGIGQQGLNQDGQWRFRRHWSISV
jgi:hypothetical protein